MKKGRGRFRQRKGRGVESLKVREGKKGGGLKEN